MKNTTTAKAKKKAITQEESIKTRHISAGTVNLTVNVPEEIREALGELASRDGMKLSEYLRRVFHGLITNQIRFTSTVTTNPIITAPPVNNALVSRKRA